jgi:hypothetical protein
MSLQATNALDTMVHNADIAITTADIWLDNLLSENVNTLREMQQHTHIYTNIIVDYTRVYVETSLSVMANTFVLTSVPQTTNYLLFKAIQFASQPIPDGIDNAIVNVINQQQGYGRARGRQHIGYTTPLIAMATMLLSVLRGRSFYGGRNNINKISRKRRSRYSNKGKSRKGSSKKGKKYSKKGKKSNKKKLSRRTKRRY